MNVQDRVAPQATTPITESRVLPIFLFVGQFRGPVPEHPHVFPQRRRGARKTVAVALGITAAIGVVEVIGALLSNSLSLLWTYKGRTRWDSNPRSSA